MKWLADSGHAWLEVELEALIQSGVAHNISEYSYVRNGFAYLEEDCDASIYLSTLKRIPKDIPETYFDGECPVRGYRPWPAQAFKIIGGDNVRS